MTAFADLHVLPKVDDDDSSLRMAKLLRMTGYSLVGLTIPPALMRERVTALRRIYHEEGMETFLRLDLAPNSRLELLRLLRRYRNTFDLLAVKCVNVAVAAVACRDRRVDIIFFDPTRRNMRFNFTYAELLRGALEFNIAADLLGTTSSEIYKRLAKEAALSRKSKCGVLLSSGTRTAEGVRSPMQLSALGQAIGLSKDQALRAVSNYPESIVRRNSERRSGTYIEEGVRLILAKAG